MKALVVLAMTGCAVAGTAFNYYPDNLYALEARHILLPRADEPSEIGKGPANLNLSPKPDQGGQSRNRGTRSLRKAERKASSARTTYRDSRQIMQEADDQNAWTQASDSHDPWSKHLASNSVIKQGELVASQQRQRGYAYSAAARAAAAANNPEREQRNARKAEAAFSGAWAASKEMQYASTKAAHALRPDLYAHPIHKKQLSDERAAYINANGHTTPIRGDGGRDTDSDNDSEGHGKPILPLAASVHGMGRDTKLYRQIKAHQESNRNSLI